MHSQVEALSCDASTAGSTVMQEHRIDCDSVFQLTSMWEEKMREELEKTTPLEEVKKRSPIRREVVIYIRKITFM
jgi:hypothetical protein